MKNVKSGFTLIEMLIVLLISGIIMSSSFGFLSKLIAENKNSVIENSKAIQKLRVLELVEDTINSSKSVIIRDGNLVCNRTNGTSTVLNNNILSEFTEYNVSFSLYDEIHNLQGINVTFYSVDDEGEVLLTEDLDGDGIGGETHCIIGIQ